MATFTPTDTEFAASTGDNMYVTPTTSIFDNPPNAFSDLTITSNPGDPEPYIFEVGDPYDLTWGGFGGGGVMDDAVVVRSGFASDGVTNVVVFEGTNTVNGETVQIIWTPDFDLEAWYWSHYTPSDDPQFYIADIDPETDYLAICLAAEARVMTAAGWRAAGELRPGDMVVSLDRGPVPIRWIGQRGTVGVGRNAPVTFEPGSIGNSRPLRLSPQHRVLISGPLVELWQHAPQALVPAKALVDGCSVKRVPVPRIDYVNFLTDSHDIVIAEGAMVETLFDGDVARSVITAQVSAGVWDAPGPRKSGHQAARPILTYREARDLAGLLRAAGHSLTAAAEIPPEASQKEKTVTPGGGGATVSVNAETPGGGEGPALWFGLCGDAWEEVGTAANRGPPGGGWRTEFRFYLP